MTTAPVPMASGSPAASFSPLPDGPAVAVTGMAGCFPGAPDTTALWRNILDARVHTDEDGKDSHQFFDAGFFGIPPAEAEVMDPQHRLFLECAWEALEAAGHDPTRLPGVTGVFAGTSFPAYLVLHLARRPDLFLRHGLLGLAVANERDSLTARLSHRLDLRGPCVTVSAFSASSLVAVHLAAQSLLLRECDTALAGASSLRLPGTADQRDVMSPTGRCRPLDAAADGTVIGSATAVVVLRRLEDALADGDHVHAVLLGSALTSDGGSRVHFTAPGRAAKADTMAEALGVAGVDPHDVGYLEMHAMGTPLGDAIEIDAVREVFAGRPASAGPCVIGSAAANVGHLDAASGMAGLVKTVLMLEHGVLPPQAAYDTPAAELAAAGDLFEVTTSVRPWTAPAGRPRVAGVNSFGMGGANVHLVLQEPPVRPAPGPRAPAGPHVLVFSARSEAAVEEAVRRLRERLAERPDLDLADVAYTLQTGRTAFAHRRAYVCADRDEALRALAAPGHPEGSWLPEEPAGDLARRWLSGESVDWSVLHRGRAPRRVPLPGYPFERERHWVDAPLSP
ncbi:beta-ketoacyl synthase N-terminal-like domain-containing protein [Streptomyces ipomoeae]|uniref:beta-ketoacyl synthase N-terminal-like domain-containing protein n=1 Tax=Streptomyces ipomoeae TaxID=103232 RepID=UPI0011477E3D|nr:polyketide synthase [Streptomyces ipomoeae]MDX2939093.1 beta-ketoacyl synthase N-terminal-like domain-containing protein [Streptomyces ipomoeae]TQE30884.1 hypothetical protein SipoB123_03055 [Streptomyces ipomoeae]